MDKLKLKIVELIDEGHTLESSTELQALIGESEELKKFHADLLRSEAKLEDFMNQEGVAEVQADLKDFIDQELGLKETKQTLNAQRYLPFAIAAGFMLFAFNFFMPMDQEDAFAPAIEETFALVEPEIVEPEVIEEANAVYFVELQEDETLWNKSGELAADLDVDRYQVMYALYEANKDSFENNDINKIQYGQELVLQEEMIFAMSPGEANDVVNRHIYCGC
jgi:hypothetical protein